MPKEIILYNLAPHVTEEQYKDYVNNEKGPLLESLPSVEEFELVKITGSMKGESPYQYVGILHIKDLEQFTQQDAPSDKFQGFLAKWRTMVAPDFHALIGKELY